MAMYQQLGKWMIVAGIVLAAMGGLLLLAGRLGLGKLPGDVSFGGRNWRVYLPLGTCILLSILLSVVMWIILRIRKG
jgi:hypothetical protein